MKQLTDFVYNLFLSLHYIAGLEYMKEVTVPKSRCHELEAYRQVIHNIESSILEVALNIH